MTERISINPQQSEDDEETVLTDARKKFGGSQPGAGRPRKPRSRGEIGRQFVSLIEDVVRVLSRERRAEP